jgi:hypothetical protein
MVLHNTIILCGWVEDPAIVLEWHHKFWARARTLTAPQRNNTVPHTVKDIIHSHMRFQRQWATWSETHTYLDSSIKQSLPDDEDMVDARMTLQPMYATHKQAPVRGKGGEDQQWRTATRGKDKKGKGKAKLKGKAKGKAITPAMISMADRLANATNTSRTAILGQYVKGKSKKGKGKGKGKAKKGKDKGGKPRGKGTRTQCIDWLAGNCERGEACTFAHE